MIQVCMNEWIIFEIIAIRKINDYPLVHKNLDELNENIKTFNKT